MNPFFVVVFKGWRWVDYFQLIHSMAFFCFGILILIRLGSHSSLLAYLVGSSFLFFGLYRLTYFILFFYKVFQEFRKDSPVQ